MKKKVNRIAKRIFITVAAVIVLVLGVLLAKFYLFTPANGVKSLTFLGSDNKKIVSVDVEYQMNGIGGRVEIEDLSAQNEGINTTVGNMGHPINITAKKRTLEQANIKFKYDASLISDEQASKLAIAYYNEELGRMELLGNSSVDLANNTVSVTTTHFSEYVVVDSDEWYNAWAESQLIIRDMNSGNKYFDVIFTLDVSGSMEGNDKNGLSKLCTYNFIRNLYAGDYFTVLSFDDSIEYITSKQIAEDVTSWEYIKNKIDAINAGGGTNIENAVLNSLEALEPKQENCKSLIVLLSDGQASISDETLQKAVNANTKIITIGLGNDADEKLLQRIADSTGGQYYKATSDNLDIIFEKIRESYIGLDLSEDTDNDGIPDKIETTGMRNQYGVVIRTDPNKADTDNDGISDGVEMGTVVINEDLSEEDKNRSLNQYVYFNMISDPTVYDENKEYNPKIILEAKADLSEDKTKINLSVNVGNSAKLPVEGKDPNNQINALKNVSVKISMPECMGDGCVENLGNVNSGENASFSDELIHNQDACKGDKHIITITVFSDNTEDVIKELRIKGIYWFENLSDAEKNDTEMELIERVRAYCSYFDEDELRDVLDDDTLSIEEKKEYIEDKRNTLPQRWAMTYLCNDDIFVAHSFRLYFESRNLIQKGSFDMTKLILGDGVVTTVLTDPDKTRYKKMLVSYIKNNYEKEKERIEVNALMNDLSSAIDTCSKIISEIEKNQAALTIECNTALGDLKACTEYLKRSDKTLNRTSKNGQ